MYLLRLVIEKCINEEKSKHNPFDLCQFILLISCTFIKLDNQVDSISVYDFIFIYG